VSEHPEPAIIRPWAAEGDNWELAETPLDPGSWPEPAAEEKTEAAGRYIRVRYGQDGEQQR
jgi:hypothetical protein